MLSDWNFCVKWNTLRAEEEPDAHDPDQAPSPRGRGYARGEETRARIVTTALRVFGEEGFNKASTRQIAADAG